MLSSKIRMNVWRKKIASFPRKHVDFYMKYAFLVSRALRKPRFQRFLHWLLKKEDICEDMVRDIQIRVFPHKKENGNSLAGRWNSEGEIHIYPKGLKFYRKLVAQSGKETARNYIKSRARAALIHEILHTKYSNDEEKVRKLTKRYFNIFVRKVKTQNWNYHINEMLFRQYNSRSS